MHNGPPAHPCSPTEQRQYRTCLSQCVSHVIATCSTVAQSKPGNMQIVPDPSFMVTAILQKWAGYETSHTHTEGSER